MEVTARSQYIDTLTELVKEEAPTLFLEDFIYYYNKAISEYMKARYELYEVNQQLTDDLRCWKKDYSVDYGGIPSDINISIKNELEKDTKYGYRHLLSCIVGADLKRPDPKCPNQKANATNKFKATRMSSEVEAGIINNSYLKPEYYRPYFKIGGDILTVDIGQNISSAVGNIKIDLVFLKQPEYVDLTEDQLQGDIDSSQVLEFSEDVAGEILKVLMKLVLERGSNPRIQSHIGVNQSISDMSTGFRGG